MEEFLLYALVNIFLVLSIILVVILFLQLFRNIYRESVRPSRTVRNLSVSGRNQKQNRLRNQRGNVRNRRNNRPVDVIVMDPLYPREGTDN